MNLSPLEPLPIVAAAQAFAVLLLVAYAAFPFWKMTAPAFWRTAFTPFPVYWLSTPHARYGCLFLTPVGIMKLTKPTRRMWLIAQAALTSWKMNFRMLRPGAQLEIFNAIVGSIFVFVMNKLQFCQRSAKMGAHYEPVFKHPTSAVRAGMIWGVNLHVSVPDEACFGMKSALFSVRHFTIMPIGF